MKYRQKDRLRHRKDGNRQISVKSVITVKQEDRWENRLKEMHTDY